MIRESACLEGINLDEPTTGVQISGAVELKPLQCGTCAGMGVYEGDPCPTCKGHGLVYLPVWMVIVPKGAEKTPRQIADIAAMLKKRNSGG